MKWAEISAVSWREAPALTLILISHAHSIARSLRVPGQLYGEARRVLRDRIQSHDITMGPRLDLGRTDDRDAV
jgi:hypothetical protein